VIRMLLIRRQRPMTAGHHSILRREWTYGSDSILLEQGADPTTGQGWLDIITPSDKGHVEVIRILFEHAD
jgi:hypothetical protein